MAQGSESKSGDVTSLIGEFVAGIPGAQDRLFPIIYDELHRLAAGNLRRERPDHSLCPTALVNEAYLRLVQQRNPDWKDRAHFFRIAARIIRRVLVDHARAQKARKRGGDGERRTFSTAVDARSLHSKFHQLDILALEEALEQLWQHSAPRAQVVELRFFAGLSVRETAAAVGLHEITVKRHWKFAQAWLCAKMGESKETGETGESP